jgi:hypothetical protein
MISAADEQSGEASGRSAVSIRIPNKIKCELDQIVFG